MTTPELVFSVLALIGAGGAVLLVTAKNVVHAALYLVVTLAAVAAVYLVLTSEFVAWTQVLIYVGAIVVLLLFSLMLTRAPIGREALDNQRRGVAFGVGLAVFGGLFYLLQDAFPWKASEVDPVQGTAGAVGESIFRDFVLPFEAISFLLLAALIGAIVLSRKDDAP